MRSLLNPSNTELRREQRDATNAVMDAALRGVVNAKDLDIEWPLPQRVPPLWNTRQHRRNVHRTSVRYGPRPTQLMDVWRRDDLPDGPAPVLLFVHGGAWVHGSRMLQGYALMSHLAEKGWVCLSIDYRVALHNPWPAHITDVKTAIAWARAMPGLLLTQAQPSARCCLTSGRTGVRNAPPAPAGAKGTREASKPIESRRRCMVYNTRRPTIAGTPL